LTSLHTLDMTNNNLRALPPLLGKLRNSLRVLLLEGNPLRSIRRALITAGCGPLLEYLLTRIPENQL
jgi:Leucine-rich repeat (LRR) protein